MTFCHNTKIEKEAAKTASFIWKLFYEGQKDRVFVRMDRNAFVVGFEPFRVTEHAYYIGNDGQSEQEIKQDLLRKMDQTISEVRSHRHYYQNRGRYH